MKIFTFGYDRATFRDAQINGSSKCISVGCGKILHITNFPFTSAPIKECRNMQAISGNGCGLGPNAPAEIILVDQSEPCTDENLRLVTKKFNWPNISAAAKLGAIRMVITPDEIFYFYKDPFNN